METDPGGSDEHTFCAAPICETTMECASAFGNHFGENKEAFGSGFWQ